MTQRKKMFQVLENGQTCISRSRLSKWNRWSHGNNEHYNSDIMALKLSVAIEAKRACIRMQSLSGSTRVRNSNFPGLHENLLLAVLRLHQRRQLDQHHPDPGPQAGGRLRRRGHLLPRGLRGPSCPHVCCHLWVKAFTFYHSKNETKEI